MRSSAYLTDILHPRGVEGKMLTSGRPTVLCGKTRSGIASKSRGTTDTVTPRSCSRRARSSCVSCEDDGESDDRVLDSHLAHDRPELRAGVEDRKLRILPHALGVEVGLGQWVVVDKCQRPQADLGLVDQPARDQPADSACTDDQGRAAGHAVGPRAALGQVHPTAPGEQQARRQDPGTNHLGRRVGRLDEQDLDEGDGHRRERCGRDDARHVVEVAGAQAHAVEPEQGQRRQGDRRKCERPRRGVGRQPRDRIAGEQCDRRENEHRGVDQKVPLRDARMPAPGDRRQRDVRMRDRAFERRRLRALEGTCSRFEIPLVGSHQRCLRINVAHG